MNADEPLRYCQHYNCQIDTAVELAIMAKRTGRDDLWELASKTDKSTVRCRMLPRKGPIHARFARSNP